MMTIMRFGALPTLLVILAACGGTLPAPEIRSVVIYSGERIITTPERMSAVEAWLRPQLDHIGTSRRFLIRVIPVNLIRYPWNAIKFEGADVVEVEIAEVAPDAETPFLIYSHLRFLQEQGGIGEWAPELEGLEGFELEKGILTRVSDVWLLGRSAFDTEPFGPMDELMYAREHGFLDDLILTTQRERFPLEAEAYWAGEQSRLREFVAWMERTFDREQPGYIWAPPPPEEESGERGAGAAASGAGSTPRDPA